ncbi:unnamed protein product, partial [Ectocarpus sp. 12 AP-2014]
ARQQGSNNGPAAAETRRAGQVPSSAAESKPSPARGVRSAGSKSNNNGVFPPERTSRVDGNQGGAGTKRFAPSGTADSGGNSTVAATERCEGCDEEGHEFRECPHRSDSALEGSEEEEEEDEEDEEEDQDEEDESSDDG